MDLPETAPRDEDYKTAWERLNQIWGEEAPTDEAKSLAARLAPLFIDRIDELHQVMRPFGLSAPDFRGQSPKIVDMTPKVIKLVAADQGAGNREVSLEIARNGRAFSSGRRYDAHQSRAELSDAEIARTGVYRLDLDRGRDVITVVFMTFDGKPSRIVADCHQPLSPMIEGKTPDTAVDVLRARPDSESLAEFARLAIEATERSGTAKGFFKLLFSGVARQARGDVKALTTYCASGAGAASEAEAWARDATGIGRVAQSLVRRIKGEAALALLLRPVTAAIATGKTLAALQAPAA